MDKPKTKYFIDIGMGLSFLIVFITGILKMPGIRENLGFIYAIIPRAQMSFLHDWSGIIMGIFVFIHLILNWDWITNMTKNIFISKD